MNSCIYLQDNYFWYGLVMNILGKHRLMGKMMYFFGVIHKLCRLKGGGVKNGQFYLVKRRLRGGEGVKNRRFSDDVVYERPPRGLELNGAQHLFQTLG